MARRTAKQWARLVARWQDSGLTAGEFGAKVKVEPRSLHWWRWALRKRGGMREDSTSTLESLPAFLPVHIVERPPVTPENAPPAPRGPVEIVVDGRHTVRVGPGFDADTLRRVLELLGEAEPS
jgi:hypothetical protein